MPPELFQKPKDAGGWKGQHHTDDEQRIRRDKEPRAPPSPSRVRVGLSRDLSLPLHHSPPCRPIPPPRLAMDYLGDALRQHCEAGREGQLRRCCGLLTRAEEGEEIL